MKYPILAGALYSLIVFSVGFVLGTVRVLLMVPVMGETAAVLVEGPVILAVSWFVSRRLISSFRIASRLVDRFCMGSTAFSLLMLAELLLALSFFQRSIGEHLATYGELAGILGLIGQSVFGIIPIIQLAVDVSHKQYPGSE